MSGSKKDFSDEKFRAIFGLADSNHDSEALSSFRMAKAYLKKFKKTFSSYLEEKTKGNRQEQNLQELEEENTRLQETVSDFETKIDDLKRKIALKKAAQSKPQFQQPNSSATASAQNTSPPPPPPQSTYTPPFHRRAAQARAGATSIKPKGNGWKWVAGGLGAIFLMNVFADKDDAPSTTVRPADPQPKTVVAAEPPPLRPNVESDFIEWFYITRAGTPLYDMSSNNVRLNIPRDGCVERFTMINSNTINAGRLLVMATSAEGGMWSGYVRISDLKPAPAGMTEVKCFYDRVTKIEPVAQATQPTAIQQTDPSASKADTATTSIGGIGIDWTIDGAYIRVAGVHENSSAQQAGIKAGDTILTIDNQYSVSHLTAEEVREKIRGAPGTNVTLLLKRDNLADAISITLPRMTLVVNAAAKPPAQTPVNDYLVPIPKRSDSMAESMEWFGDNLMRSDINIGGERKFSRESISSLYFPIFTRDHTPQGLDARNLRRLFNYGFCGKTGTPLANDSDQNIADALNACTQNYNVHMSVTATNQIDRSVLDFMYKYSTPQNYILFAVRDGVPEKADITKLQAALNKSGFNVGSEDGNWGRKTTEGIVQFMRSQPDKFFDVSEGYIELMRQTMTADHWPVVRALALSRARTAKPDLKEKDFAYTY